MVTDVINHRESIGRFRPRALSRRKGEYLYSTLFVSLCFLNMVYLPFGLPLYYTSYFSRPGHDRLVTTDHASIITFLLCVLCILLLITGIEPNPGPGTDDSFSCSRFSSSFNDIVSHTVSFVHLNIQSIVP